MSECSNFKDKYEKVQRKHDYISVFLVLTSVALLLLSLYVFKLFACEHKNDPVFIGETIASWIGPENTKSLEFLTVLFLTGMILALYIMFGIKRAKRNPALNCPRCSKSLADESCKAHVMMTGICPHCKSLLFAGKISNEQEAIEQYQKYKTETKALVRFTFWTSILGLLAGIPICFWLKSSGELLGKEMPSYGLYLFLLPALFLSIPGSLWFISKSERKKHQRYISAFREVSQ